MLLKMNKNIPKVIPILISANKKVFLKNHDFSYMSSAKKEAINISKVSNLLALIFHISSWVFQMRRPSFFLKLGYGALTLLLEMKRVLINCQPNEAGYWIYRTCCSTMAGLPEITQILAFLLAAVTNVKVEMTEISFLALSQDTNWHNDPSCGSYNT